MLDVASSIPAPEKALRNLQRLVRQLPGADAGTAVMRKQLPDELQTDPPQEVRLVGNQIKS